jgi:hypothetical protein
MTGPRVPKARSVTRLLFSIAVRIAASAYSLAGRSHPTDKGAKVRFRLSDVFLPGPEGLSNEPSDDTEMQGAIVDFSDSGPQRRAFAVVELENGENMIVPVEKLALATS